LSVEHVWNAFCQHIIMPHVVCAARAHLARHELALIVRFWSAGVRGV
jgi:hypothetical protein